MMTRRALEEHGDADAGTSPLRDTWQDNLNPALIEHAEALVRGGLPLHGYARALNSSQCFAMNLFLPFAVGRPEGLASFLSTRLGRTVRVRGIDIEYYGSGDILAEVAGSIPNEDERFTAADAYYPNCWRTCGSCTGCASAGPTGGPLSEEGLGQRRLAARRGSPDGSSHRTFIRSCSATDAPPWSGSPMGCRVGSISVLRRSTTAERRRLSTPGTAMTPGGRQADSGQRSRAPKLAARQSTGGSVISGPARPQAEF